MTDQSHSRAHKRVGALVSQLKSPAAAGGAGASAGGVAPAAMAGDASSPSNAPPELENVKVEVKGRVALVTMNRPNALNALSDGLVNDLASAFNWAGANVEIGCMVLTGSGRAFAAGADIKEMKSSSFASMSTRDKLGPWRALQEAKIPVIAAVNGIAFGGGTEIALMQDIIIASDKALFGQPEVKLGILPGAGGTQRLPRFVGKSKAMEMCLTGNPITAAEAEKFGIVSRVVPHDQLLDVALKMAAQIASYSRPAVVLTKEAVNSAFDTTLSTGLQYERRLFHMTWGYSDAKEGTAAFAEKRAPKWQHK